MAKTKRVILFIVEGATDEDTLNPILKKIYNDTTLRFHIVRGDITTEPGTTSRNVVTKVYECVKEEKEKYRFKLSDVVKIVHIIDTDGSFVSKEKVVFEDRDRIEYTTSEIKTYDVEYIRRKNEQKSDVVSRLRATGKINSIPYEIYYMSRNLEHVLHNVSDDLTTDEKIELADAFVDEYENNIEGFIEFISKSSFSVQGNFNETWEFIYDGVNSLNRYSNIHLMLKENPRES